MRSTESKSSSNGSVDAMYVLVGTFILHLPTVTAELSVQRLSASGGQQFKKEKKEEKHNNEKKRHKRCGKSEGQPPAY